MILEIEFCGLMKVISGGQCGVDRAGLDAAYVHSVATGGTAPNGWRTWYGPDPELGTKFGLVEHWSPNYQYRTKQNIQDADGTIVLATNFDSAGTALTINTCRITGKPLCMIDLNGNFLDQFDRATKWLKDNAISTLNVAGNRGTGTGENAQVNYDRAFSFLDTWFSILDYKNLLVVPQHK